MGYSNLAPPFFTFLRCRVTHNPCGTDTWAIGYCCPCAPCQQFIVLYEIERQYLACTERGG